MILFHSLKKTTELMKEMFIGDLHGWVKILVVQSRFAFDNLFLEASRLGDVLCWFILHDCWKAAGKRWKALESAGKCWKVLESAGKCWKALESAGKCWKAPKRAGKR